MNRNNYYQPDCPEEDNEVERCRPIINKQINNSSACSNDGVNGGRKCAPTELLKNGGFEERGEFNTFAHWEESNVNNIDISRNTTSYEFRYSGRFESLPLPGTAEKTAVISQTIPVEPGCFVTLNFADNFQQAGTGFQDLDIRARVYYTEGSQQVNLIDLEIDYDSDQAGLGFVFHQKSSNNPIPLNVSALTVEFRVELEDVGDVVRTIWLIDGVSLRQV